MKVTDFDFIQATGVRRAVVPAGDIRGDIGFQNDINTILAGLDAKNPPIEALGWMQQSAAGVSAGAPVFAGETGLRVIKGGGIRVRMTPDADRRLSIARRASV